MRNCNMPYFAVTFITSKMTKLKQAMNEDKIFLFYFSETDTNSFPIRSITQDFLLCGYIERRHLESFSGRRFAFTTFHIRHMANKTQLVFLQNNKTFLFKILY